ncbi:Clp protease N-terminal domain-containing protein [Qaidamihabitans albus]|uniref:Clp protease N-terminal domain-containing protein n=1 Tax=Qaidamihabitans albus TaxID=2795733 RepID=UPI0018F273C1|nr:Clp protease N-terminal domain-containing protein [Qaidamihabitans albus]
MFERFTKEARVAVIEAQDWAIEQQVAEIDVPHLLLALLGASDTAAVRLLVESGLSIDLVVEELNAIRRRGGLSDADAEALEQLGIDLERVVERVEQAHGEYALADRAEGSRRGRFAGRQHRPFTHGAKRVLEHSLREAQDLGDKDIGTEHILLAVVTQPGPTADMLATYGIDHVTLRRALTRRRAS